MSNRGRRAEAVGRNRPARFLAASAPPGLSKSAKAKTLPTRNTGA